MILPAINAKTFAEAKAAAEIITTLGAEWVHLDVANSTFTDNTLWGDPKGLQELIAAVPALQNMKIEVHLMIDEPEKVVAEWMSAGASRVIVHHSTLTNPSAVIEACADASLGIAPVEDVRLAAQVAQEFGFENILVLAVVPGTAGQQFGSLALDRIRFLHAELPHVTIEVDGGMNDGTVKQARGAGATNFVSASYILKAKSPRGAFHLLEKAYYFKDQNANIKFTD